MNRHLSDYELEGLINAKINGRELVDGLEHLETCLSCRKRVNLPGSTQVINSLFADVLPQVQLPAKRESIFAFWQFASVGLSLLLFLGATALFFRYQNSDGSVVVDQSSSTANNILPTTTPEVLPTANSSQPLIENPQGTKTPETLVAGESTPQNPVAKESTTSFAPVAKENISQALPEIKKAKPVQELQLRIPNLSELSSKNATLLGESESEQKVKMLTPNGIVIREQSPYFEWTDLPDANNRTVGIFAAKDGNKVAESKSDELIVAENRVQWKPKTNLRRGQTYIWQVKTELKDGTLVKSPQLPVTDVRFSVLSQKDENRLRKLEKKNASPLQLGVAYANVGLLKEAEQQLKIALQNPKTKAKATNYLKKIQKIRNQ